LPSTRNLFSTTGGRALAILGVTAAALIGLATPAFAHITVNPSSAPAGSTAELTFRIPNEEAKANVTKVQIQVPVAHPIAQFLVRPVPGWTITVHNVTLAHPLSTDDGTFTTAVDEVTWTGGAIAPGQYQDFSVSADPLPAGVSQLAFKAIQTYSNGDVVRWIDLPQPGLPAPDHPAPIHPLTPAGATAAASPNSSLNGTSPGSSDTAGLALGTASVALGTAGLAAGLLGLAVGIAAWRRARRAAMAGAITLAAKDPGREVAGR